MYIPIILNFGFVSIYYLSVFHEYPNLFYNNKALITHGDKFNNNDKNKYDGNSDNIDNDSDKDNDKDFGNNNNINNDDDDDNDKSDNNNDDNDNDNNDNNDVDDDNNNNNNNNIITIMIIAIITAIRSQPVAGSCQSPHQFRSLLHFMASEQPLVERQA